MKWSGTHGKGQGSWAFVSCLEWFGILLEMFLFKTAFDFVFDFLHDSTICSVT